MITPRLYRRRITWVASLVALFLLYHFFSLRSDLDAPAVAARTKTSQNANTSPNANANSNTNQKSNANNGEKEQDRPICPPLPGMEDILVVLKTGVTEALDKVPVHFQTTLRCVPNYVVFSDHDEEIAGVRVHDALRNMPDENLKQSIPDFNIYNRIRAMGRAGLAQEDFSDVANSALGKPDNPGWKLDKWKFLPMAMGTYKYKSDAKWYVFMEADTYFVWGSLLAWLEHFNPEDPLYIGTETQIADVIFAHGGSGFIVSNPAMKRVVDEYSVKSNEIHAYTAGHWAGDCVLGKILLDVGVPLHFSWPMLQNTAVAELDEFSPDFYRRPWCYPAVAFHHLSALDIQSLWEFEQKRYKESRKTLLLHGDVFKERIYPELSSDRSYWDNLSTEEHSVAIDTYEDCQALCATAPQCAQFTFRAGRCYTNKTPKMGHSSADASSGWIMKRVDAMLASAPKCRRPDFG
ncbi:hypothetical protein SI65_06399 [Aspergillus cristatus]|uniref:N-acetylgalactosaminide beta-1,3-galactosyltransferase n=1 Tax=Aspergillus cristatus TaxID=573508 RepID=A0A1E3BC45_ASPCR|nr:hypothetical protein SI65_06399 [Aspergillus cristatus]